MIELPYPPSINNYWGNRVVPRGGSHTVMTYVKPQARRYRQEVLVACQAQKAERFGDALLEVKLAVYPPDRRKRDLDNVVKAIFDSLQEAKVFDDDKQIVKFTVERMQQVPGGEVLVHIVRAA